MCYHRGWYFLIDGRLGKGYRSSLENRQFRYHRGWEIGMGFCDRWEIGQGFSDRSIINNQKFCDHMLWEIRLVFCDIWEDGKG